MQIFVCCTIFFNCFSFLCASTLLDQGILGFEQGRFSDAKPLFQAVNRNGSKSFETLTSESYLFAIINENKFPCGNQKLTTHILRQAIKTNDKSCLFYKVLMTKITLFSFSSTSAQRSSSLLYLKKISKKYPYAGYIVGQYLETAKPLKLDLAKKIYFQTAHGFEESKKRVLALRKKEIQTYIRALDEDFDSIDMKKVYIDLKLGFSSQYVDYDIATFFNFLLTTNISSTFEKVCSSCLSYIAQSGSHMAEAFYYIFRKVMLQASKNLDLSSMKRIKASLMLKAQKNDSLYLASYALYKLHSLHAIYLDQAELCKTKSGLVKLKKLGYAPALYEVHRNLKIKNGKKSSAVLGDASAQYAIANDYFIESNGDSALIKKGLFWLHSAAKRSYIPAQLQLGEIYYEGQYTKKHIDRALFWLKKATKNGSIKAKYILGTIYGQDSERCFNPNLSLKYLKQAADSFYPPAINLMGEIYLKGKHIPRNYQIALEYFVIGAEWKYLDSIYNLAWMIQRGRGTNKNENVATTIFKYGAELDDPRAQHHLAWRYLLGIGTQIDITKALGWMRKAANNGYVKSAYQLGKIYYFGDKGVPQNLSLSLSYFELAAHNGCFCSQYYLGDAFKRGIIVDQSDDKAAHWFLKSAKNGHIKASYEIGLLYLWGVGVAQSLNKAFFWLKKAAENNHFPACNKLGSLYFLGLGTDEDIAKALQWYRKASDCGEIDSTVVLAWICFYSINLIEQGVNYAKLASNNNHPVGLFLTGTVKMYLDSPASNRKNTLKLDTIRNNNEASSRYYGFLKMLECNNAFAFNLPVHLIERVLNRRELKWKFIRASRLICP